MPETTHNSELFNLLMDIRKNEAQMGKLVKKLEGDIPNRGEDVADFYKRYTIFVLKKYCHSLDDRELMLAACGFLHGNSFHDKNMENRIVAYWEHSRSYNKLFEDIKTKKSAIRTSSKHMNHIIGYLTEELLVDMNENNGKLGLINEVPDKLELPSPRIAQSAKETQSDNGAKINESNEHTNNNDIANVLDDNNIFPTITSKEIEESQPPQDGSRPKSRSEISKNISSKKKASEPSMINIQASNNTGQDKNEPTSSNANNAKRHKCHKKRKVNMSAKSESTAVAAAGSYVSVHIVNVVGEPKKSNNATLIQGIGEKIQKIFLLGSEELVEQSPDSLDKDKTRKRNRRVSKRNMLGVILVLVVLFIIVIVIFQSPQSTPVMSDYPLQSEQEWLKLNMENMNREMGGNTVNGVKATIEYSITDPDTSQEYTYTKVLSLEQNTAELEEPVDENIN